VINKINIFDNVLFAVTREDFKIEYEIIKDRNYKKILSVCSGGCVPLSLKTLLNELEITAFDINTHQLKHLEKKVNSIKEKKYYDNEEDRLRAIRNINSKIQSYNDWLEKDKEEKGIEATLQWYEQSPFNEWALNFYLTYSSLNQSD
jgi:S-adenosylmethionine:diacylglycerol 3-amino-3-carboxypropyl transferase